MGASLASVILLCTPQGCILLRDSRRSSLQNYGRKNAAAAYAGACPTYITGNSGCGAFNPTLALTPSATTKFTFEPAGGNSTRFYIKQSVSSQPAVHRLPMSVPVPPTFVGSPA